MFSGIIESTEPILSTDMQGKCKRVSIKKPAGWKFVLGESVSVDGICSTVVEKGAKSFAVEYMPETLSKTTAPSFVIKKLVNLERSLVFGARVHGHFVAGHVDAVGKITRIQRQGRARAATVSFPRELKRFIAPRGSVAVNGVSLTVATVRGSTFDIALIPHTLSHTNLSSLVEGSIVNIECDVLARYGTKAISGRVSAHATK